MTPNQTGLQREFHFTQTKTQTLDPAWSQGLKTLAVGWALSIPQKCPFWGLTSLFLGDKWRLWEVRTGDPCPVAFC